MSMEEGAVGFRCGYQTIKNYESGYRGSGAAFQRNLRRYCEWLAEEAVRRGKPQLALSPEELAPDVFGAVAGCRLPVASGPGEEAVAGCRLPVASGPGEEAVAGCRLPVASGPGEEEE